MIKHSAAPHLAFLVILGLFSACSGTKKAAKTGVAETAKPSAMDTIKKAAEIPDPANVFMENLMKGYPGVFENTMAHKKDLNVQIVYTLINRDQNNIPHFETHTYNTTNAAYYYPASTVKLPVVLLALQRVNELADKGVTENSTMVTEKAYSGQTATYNDPNTIDGKPNIAQYIKRILLVSDNEAFNRLYEFLGQEYINTELQRKGYKSAQIIHRLDIFLSEDENRHTNPINFYGPDMKLLYAQPMQFNRSPFEKRNDVLGKGYLANGTLVNRPMNFSLKNRLNLTDLHAILKTTVFPETVSPRERFHLTRAQEDLVLKYMSEYPRESVYPSYDSSYNDAYAKFLMVGGETRGLPASVRIFGKSGEAYGQLLETAYIVDFEKKIEFMLSAEIYCNSNGILGDDKYDYETVGLPFLKNLGRAVYDYESKRKKTYLPDLGRVKFEYDKQ